MIAEHSTDSTVSSMSTRVALVETTDDGARELARACRTAVSFCELTEREIAAYVASGEPLDKAGAYAIQGGAAAFVTHIYGDFTKLVDLPLSTVEEMFPERPGRRAVRWEDADRSTDDK